MDLHGKLQEADRVADARAKSDLYRQILHSIVLAPTTESLQEFADHLMLEDVPLVLSRAILQEISTELTKLPHEIHKAVAIHILMKVQPRVISFEEQVSSIREALAEIFIEEENWTEAAKTLIAIPLDTGNRVIDEIYKAKIYVKIARLHLENDDIVQAESYVTRSSSTVANCNDKELQIAHKVCFARILDGKRRFLDAASRYLEISNLVGAEEQMQSLEYAAICAILAGAGPRRSQVLSKLYKDERCSRLEVFPVLEKVFFDRLLANEEIEKLTAHLKPHHLAITSEGGTVLDRAMIEHNLLAASKLYQNISLVQLGTLLRVDKERAERVAARMISEDRLVGSIDQITGFVHFEEDHQAMRHWDQQIEELCLSVTKISQNIRSKEAMNVGN
eukprot:TRINITY_DN3955_c0_g1_i2.p1 TRINITY_DN3955_c0_g1~~TRINITY_DN3955_c0_g1_i2.p1  ORF type:complete len:392 (+),score=100.43 TRINITY_DN3955_c0_g1_i2:52-1227(+)